MPTGRDSPSRDTKSYSEKGNTTPERRPTPTRRNATPERRPPVSRSSPSSPGDDDGDSGCSRLNLCLKGIATIDPSDVTSKLSALYVRVNRISVLKPLAAACNLKVLDLAFNEIQPEQLPQLAACPLLQQLYLNGNDLRCLEKLPLLTDLEVLVASGCGLQTLRMPGLPQLRMLSVCDNDLDSLTGMPYLPKLEVFQFAGNPKLHERADFLTVVALACSSSLKRICSDQNPAPQLIPSEVHDIVSQYPTYAGDCATPSLSAEGATVKLLGPRGLVRAGLGRDIPSATEIAEGADVGKLADAFLIGVQQAALPHGWVLLEASMSSPLCGECCESSFVLEGAEGDLPPGKLRFQWYVPEDDGRRGCPRMAPVDDVLG
ncbi:hypothetical protein CYMTET_26383 [Cymbomonas tetramitiformis]|uniref:Uncharacterized protein n=1 Tax=Cymbomonas tetramitiformis TaxID=36881 RepID=A0AAE0FTE1_9CHLO|nr:hypothetical protein CYMTET_26383 [Cymbomonas tetramitiformis]